MPEEFLRDPSYWLQASEMELFLAQAQRVGPGGLQKMAHRAPHLRSWGVLDAVLRMMPNLEETLSQPERILAYFIAPAPPVDNVVRANDSVDFDLPISSEKYPLSTQFLAASIECLPTFVGRELAHFSWQGFHCKITHARRQPNFLESVPLGPSLSPELMRNVLATLETHAKNLEEKNRELQEKNEALIAGLKPQAASHKPQAASHKPQQQIQMEKGLSSELVEVKGHGLLELQHEIARLADYMIRAQQLMALLIGQDRKTPQVAEAMRRVDWQKVQEAFPRTVENCRRILRSQTQIQTKPNHEIRIQ